MRKTGIVSFSCKCLISFDPHIFSFQAQMIMHKTNTLTYTLSERRQYWLRLLNWSHKTDSRTSLEDNFRKSATSENSIHQNLTEAYETSIHHQESWRFEIYIHQMRTEVYDISIHHQKLTEVRDFQIPSEAHNLNCYCYILFFLHSYNVNTLTIIKTE